jgi:hypothetical protein
VLDVSRSSLTPSRGRNAPRRVGSSIELESKLQLLTQEHPTYGYRRLWALLRYRLEIKVNRKRIYRILKASDGWCISGPAHRGLGLELTRFGGQVCA